MFRNYIFNQTGGVSYLKHLGLVRVNFVEVYHEKQMNLKV